MRDAVLRHMWSAILFRRDSFLKIEALSPLGGNASFFGQITKGGLFHE